jgi:hypothetical protein
VGKTGNSDQSEHCGACGSDVANLLTGVVSLDAAAMAGTADISRNVRNLWPVSGLPIDKSMSTAGPVNAAGNLAHMFRERSTGNLPVAGVSVKDSTNGFGIAPVPALQSLAGNVAPLGDSSDVVGNDGT